jgi:hypothetical protein
MVVLEQWRMFALEQEALMYRVLWHQVLRYQVQGLMFKLPTLLAVQLYLTSHGLNYDGKTILIVYETV